MSRRIVPGKRRRPKPAVLPPPTLDPFAVEAPDGLVAISLWKNPLRPDVHESFTAQPGWKLIEWLQAFFPNGFGRPISVVWNGYNVEIEDTDRRMEAGDVIGLYVLPGGPAFVGILVASLISAVATLAATMLVNVLFGKPSKPGVDTPKPDPIYDLNGASNSARLGEPVPALYGRVIAVPDWAMQPYSFFQNNDQYLDQILVIGLGRFTVENVLVGETPVSALAPGAVQYWIVDNTIHTSTMGKIEDAYGIMENVITSPEVSNQELGGTVYTNLPGVFEVMTFTAPSTMQWTGTKPSSWPATLMQEYTTAASSPNVNKQFTVKSYDPVTGIITVNETTVTTFSDGQKKGIAGWTVAGAQSAGPFVVGKPGVRGNRVMCDVVWPGGLYTLDNNGALLSQTVTVKITCQPIDDAGANAGAAIVNSFVVNRATNTPVRLTFTIDVPVGRYSVKLERVEPPPTNTKTVNSFTWTGLKFRLSRATGSVYSNTTLLAIRIKATNGITGTAASRVRVTCTRQLAPLGTGTRVATRNPADAFVDIMTNLTYGARRPLSEVDTATLAALSTHWAGRVNFDAAFATKSTVWDALVAALQPAAAAPLPDGQLMSAVQDGQKALRTQFYSDANMVRGSLELSYEFAKTGDHDGYRVEYRDPATFTAQYALYPATSVDPEQASLFGCTDAATANGYAKLLWQRRQYQRRFCRFESELEGMLPRFGDRMAVSAQMPKWGQSGVLTDAAGLTVTTDEPLDWTGGAKVMMLRDERGRPSGLISVTRGADDFIAVLAADPGFPIVVHGAEESTHYAFGDSTTVVRDFIVAGLSHDGGVRTTISGVVYDAQTWAGTLPWLEEPI